MGELKESEIRDKKSEIDNLRKEIREKMNSDLEKRVKNYLSQCKNQ